MATCANPTLTAEQAHQVGDGDRHVKVNVKLDWGAGDIRGDWEGDLSFCSFGCLEEWATEMAARHDAHVLEHGVTPEGDES